VQERLTFSLLSKAEKSHDPMDRQETLKLRGQLIIKGPEMKIGTGKGALTHRT